MMCFAVVHARRLVYGREAVTFFIAVKNVIEAPPGD